MSENKDNFVFCNNYSNKGFITKRAVNGYINEKCDICDGGENVERFNKENVPKVIKPEKHNCHCNLHTVVNFGCKCGGI